MKGRRKITIVYAAIIAFVVGWWFLAFRQPSAQIATNSSVNVPSNNHLEDLRAQNITLLSIDRDLLTAALSGNFDQMARYIADWDIDAQILEAGGISGIKRLPSPDFLRSQVLIRQIEKGDPNVHGEDSADYLIDAANVKIDLRKSYQRLLPQTFAAASFLLALVAPEQIIASPRHLREQERLYPKDLTDKIPLDIDRYNGEKLFQASPDIAFVAKYSHPATLQALHNQSITLYTMQNLTSLKALSDELMNIGMIINRSREAELLKIFIDAALIALDNKQRIMIEHYATTQTALPSLLVLNYHNTFSVPSKDMLNGQILERLSVFNILSRQMGKEQNSGDWSVPIDRERLLFLNPDSLIIVTDSWEVLQQEFFKDLALRNLSAIKNHRLFFVDEAIHHSPTQYIILAYHDLIELLDKLP